MGLPPSLPSWRSTHELFDLKSLRRCAGHLTRVRWTRPRPRHLKSPSPMMANQTTSHVPSAAFGEMTSNNVQRPKNQSVQMVEQKDRYVEHSLPLPSRNTAQTQRHRRRTT